MILGALIHAGLDVEALTRELAKLNLDEWHLHVSTTHRHAIAATRVEVHAHDHAGHAQHGTDADTREHTHEHSHSHGHDHHGGGGHRHHGHHHTHDTDGAHTHDHPHRGLDDILALIDRSNLPDGVKRTASRIFDRLAEAEANAHRVSKHEVHFHEVGAIDALIDIVGAATGLDLMGIEAVYCSPLPVGRGFVRCDHGMMPIPVPGTMELLKDVPVYPTSIDRELITPTGAAIVTTLASGFGRTPEMTVRAVGYGAGKRDLIEQPNMLRVVIGDRPDAATAFQTDTVHLIETNIDDQSPEAFGYLVDQLLAAGALDAYFTPITMKKGRPAYQLSVLAEPDAVEGLSALVLRETSTFGVRVSPLSRRKVAREVVRVTTRFGEVRVKVGTAPDILKIAPEYDDCRRAAELSGAPIREVYDAAIEAYRSVYGQS